MSLKYGELFAGYGGLGLGVQSVLGGEMAWCAEFDKAPSKILAHHWPDVPNLGDVTKVDWSQVEPVDVITGGSPCQDLSHAGKRLGMKAGTRSGLWASMCDAIDIIRPRLVVWENVQGALSAEATSALMPPHFDEQIKWHLRVAAGTRSTHVRRLNNRAAHRLMEYRARRVGDGRPGPVLRALGRVLGDLSDLGYDAAWYGLRAADVGAAHGRFRIFVFAQPADADAERGGWDGGAPEQIGRPLARTVAAGSGEAASGGLTLLPTPAVNDMGAAYTPETWDAWTAKMQAKHGNGNGHGRSLSIEAQRLLPTPVSDNSRGLPSSGTDYASLPNAVVSLLPTPRATDGTKGGPNQAGSSGDRMLPSAVQPNRWGDYAPAIARWEHAIGRPAPAPTEPGAKGNPRLSPAFVEWLMGLPAGHVTDPAIGISRNDQLKAIGNGVVPQQATAATRAFIHDISKESAA